jgi:hypothetical protein
MTTTDTEEFERQLVFCHARLMEAYGHFDEPVDPEAAIAALVWTLVDVIKSLPECRHLMEVRRINESLTDILSVDSDEPEPVEPPASLALN